MKQKIFIGWDPKETRAWDVARHSILKRTTNPKTQIIPLQLQTLRERGIFTRPVETRDGKLWCPISQAPMATEFAISRFAVPILQRNGWALFVDCDIVCLGDISELFSLADEKYAVMVVKHNYEAAQGIKMVDQVQTSYARKNWSSVVLWNCGHPSNRKIENDNLLNTWPGRDLHAFKWLDDSEIGELPQCWNYLVGVYPDQAVSPGILHYTLGGPWLPNWPGHPLDKIWLDEAATTP